MTLFLSFLCLAASLFLTAGNIYLKWPIFLDIPDFAAAAAALVGVLIAALEYRARKTKKKRKAPMALLIANAFAGILAMGYWLYLLLIVGSGLFS